MQSNVITRAKHSVNIFSSKIFCLTRSLTVINQISIIHLCSVRGSFVSQGKQRIGLDKDIVFALLSLLVYPPLYYTRNLIRMRPQLPFLQSSARYTPTTLKTIQLNCCLVGTAQGQLRSEARPRNVRAGFRGARSATTATHLQHSCE